MEQNHDLKVEFQRFPFAQYYDQLTMSLATGEMPDVFLMSPSDWRRYAEGGVALPLDNYLPDYLNPTFSTGGISELGTRIKGALEPKGLYYKRSARPGSKSS